MSFLNLLRQATNALMGSSLSSSIESVPGGWPPGPDAVAPRPPPESSRPRITESALTTAVSYFIPKPLFTDDSHKHFESGEIPSPAYIEETSQILIDKGIPPELIPRILEEAQYWSVCYRKCVRPMVVKAQKLGTRLTENVGTSGTSPKVCSLCGQEHSLKDEIEMEGSGLKDKDGECWYLVTEPIGCADRHWQAAREAESPHPTEIDDSNEKKDPGRPPPSEKALGTRASKGERNALKASESGEQAAETGNSSHAEGEEAKEVDQAKVEEKAGAKGWLREIYVEILSKDQGWSSGSPEHYGTYNHTYSWFELALLRQGKEVEDSRTEIQRNVHAGQYFKHHQICFDKDHPFVKLAQSGDRVVLWALARYPGWQNQIREASITLYTAPFPMQT